MAFTHGTAFRTGEGLPQTALFKSGKFGRLFPHLPPLKTSKSALLALSKAMIEAAPLNPSGDNPTILSGFTYLGQFVDHDITFDTTTVPETRIDPLAVYNFRGDAI